MNYYDFKFHCPHCGRPLNLENQAFLCKRCSKKFVFKDGIPSFTDNTYYYGGLPTEEAGHIIHMAMQNRMSELKSHLKSRKISGRKVFLKSFEDNSADGRFLLPMDKRSMVLDLGCGFGALSVPISRVCGRIVAVDATYERIRFLDLRARREGLTNLMPVHANLLELPLGKSMFDFVLMNGVLEWVGEWLKSKNARDVQLRALKKARDLLKPDGVLYLAIENRFGLELLFRRKDHNKLYFTSYMPRKIADIVTRALKGKPYRTYTYGHGGYRQLMEEAGFTKISFYCPWPRYQTPRHIMCWGDNAAFTYFRKKVLRDLNFKEYFIFTVLAWFHLDWFFTSSFIILAQKK